MDRKKIIIICLIIVAVFLYLVASNLAEQIFDWADLPITSHFGLSIPQYTGVGLAVLSLVLVFKNQRFMAFLDEAYAELAKVVYPTKKESGQSGLVVVVIVGIATGFLAIFDWAWSAFTSFVLNVSGV